MRRHSWPRPWLSADQRLIITDYQRNATFATGVEGDLIQGSGSGYATLKTISSLYRKRGKLRVGKVSRIALYFAYRWKSFAIPTMHC